MHIKHQVSSKIGLSQCLISNFISDFLFERGKKAEIENIMTTQDDLYKRIVRPQQLLTVRVKQVYNEAKALKTGFNFIKETD